MAEGPKFTVDTKLFRELGELLVGRESTALVELIKNAYDADATTVKIVGQALKDPEKGVIVVADDGIGMNSEEFTRGFLRIAGRTKVEGDRRSPWFKRRFTGEKGVGRLAAHKLARVLVVESSRWDDSTERDDLAGFRSKTSLTAKIDWERLEKLETLDQVPGSGAVSVTPSAPAKTNGTRSGTTLRLSPLRRVWKTKDIERFHAEVATLLPPEVLVAPLPGTVATSKLLFEGPRVRDETSNNKFDVEYFGDLAVGDPTLATKAESADWIIEARSDGKKVKFAIEPSTRFRQAHPSAEGFRASRTVGPDARGLEYDLRILERHNQPWDKVYQGIRVYYEGFRVLPYGDPADDWLDLNRDAKSRTLGRLGSLGDLEKHGLQKGDEREGYAIKGSSVYFGGIFLTRERAPGLQLLINREGFLPGPAFDELRHTVRTAIDVCTRLRHLATAEVKDERRQNLARQREAAVKATVRESPSAFVASELAEKIRVRVEDAMVAARGSTSPAVTEKLREVRDALAEATGLLGEATNEAAMLRVLAAIGLEQGAFLHEVNSLALTADSIVSALEGLAEDIENRKIRSRLKSIANDARDLRERLRRNAAYITDVAGVGGRKRRSRQVLADRFGVVSDFFQHAAQKRKVSIEPKIPGELKTPPMFPAEVTALFSNLMSNAIKFAGVGGSVCVRAKEDGPELVIRVENTGEPVDLETSEKWFLPFKSTTLDVDEALGQGMGLGLTIVRSLIDEYGGTVRFVKPHSGYSTAIEVKVPAT